MGRSPMTVPQGQGGPCMRTQTAVGVLLLMLAILVAAGVQLTRVNG